MLIFRLQDTEIRCRVVQQSCEIKYAFPRQFLANEADRLRQLARTPMGDDACTLRHLARTIRPWPNKIPLSFVREAIQE